MADITAIAAAFGALKGAGDIVKAMVGLRDAEMIRAKAIELQGVVIDAHAALFALQVDHAAMNRELEAAHRKLRDIEDFGAERERYALTEVGPRAFAYVVKEAMRDGEPSHALCASCFQQRKKSILQSRGVLLGVPKLGCDTCGATLDLPYEAER